MRGGIEAKRDLFNAGAAAKVFLRDGAGAGAGDVDPSARTGANADRAGGAGRRRFYKGAVAKRFVDGVKKIGGIWSLQDLAGYQVKERKPLYGEYHGVRIISAPPPSSGGVALIDALNILSGYDLKSLDSATRKHLVVEAMRRSHRDRAEYLGDPDFVAMPVERLIQSLLRSRTTRFHPHGSATPSAALPGITAAEPGPQTTHFSIIDAEGNRVAGTMSINFFFGSGLMVPGTGMMLNNEMDDFATKPGVPNGFRLVGADANAVAPGKRPLSSMTPTFIEKSDGVMILGTPGGSYIMGMVLLATLDWIDGMPADEIVKKGRYHHQYMPDTLSFEPGASRRRNRRRCRSTATSCASRDSPATCRS